jgi:hypothetical protein
MSMHARHNLTGQFFVRLLHSTLKRAEKLLPRRRDRALLRRLVLGLRYWPDHHPEDESGRVLDLDWSVIQTLGHLKIYELRIHETIGGMDNIRIIFYVAPQSDAYPMPCIWLLDVFQKKRDDFSSHQIDTFKDLRTLVNKRFY